MADGSGGTPKEEAISFGSKPVAAPGMMRIWPLSVFSCLAHLLDMNPSFSAFSFCLFRSFPLQTGQHDIRLPLPLSLLTGLGEASDSQIFRLLPRTYMNRV